MKQTKRHKWESCDEPCPHCGYFEEYCFAIDCDAMRQCINGKYVVDTPHRKPPKKEKSQPRSKEIEK